MCLYYSVHKVFQVLDPFLSSMCSNTISHKWEGLGEERKTIKPQEVGVSKKKHFQLVCSFMEFFIFYFCYAKNVSQTAFKKTKLSCFFYVPRKRLTLACQVTWFASSL